MVQYGRNVHCIRIGATTVDDAMMHVCLYKCVYSVEPSDVPFLCHLLALMNSQISNKHMNTVSRTMHFALKCAFNRIRKDEKKNRLIHAYAPQCASPIKSSGNINLFELIVISNDAMTRSLALCIGFNAKKNEEKNNRYGESWSTSTALI